MRKACGKQILDIGFGTAVLTAKLYQDGYTITGIDFSKRMIEIAQQKMPGARLIQYDFAKDCQTAFQAPCLMLSFAPMPFITLQTSRKSVF